MSSINDFIDINKYKIVGLIGKGSLGIVYKVINSADSKYYAARVVDHKNNTDTGNICRQINLLSVFNHPSLIKFLGSSPIGFHGQPDSVIITEFATNGSLYDMIDLESKGLAPANWTPTKKLINIYGISSGMAYLHSKDVLHRDLKSKNILLDHNLHPKIGDIRLTEIIHLDFIGLTTDFGLDWNITPETSKYIYLKSSEVYSFAYIVYRILTHKWPYYNSHEFISKIESGDLKPKNKDDIPSPYMDLIERCWKNDPNERPSFEQIVDELKNNKNFITDEINEKEFYDYVDFIDYYKNASDSTRIKCFDEFIKERNSIDIKSKKIDEENIFFDSSDFELTSKKLGENDSSKVLIAKNRANSIEFVAKILINGLESGKDQQLFIKSSEILFKMNHPSICKLHGISLHSINDPKYFQPTIVTEYFPNGSLRSIFNKIKNKETDKAWTPTKKLICILGISHGMKSSHKKGLFHQRLKPENILLDSNYYPKICDFKNRTNDEIIVTFCTAPELFDKDNKGNSSSAIDVYSFSMIAYEIMSGTEPFSKNGKYLKLSSLKKKIIANQRPDVNNKSITEPMKELICQCWDNDPNKRPTFSEIYQQLSSKYKSFTNEKIDEKQIKEYIENLSQFDEQIIEKADRKKSKKVGDGDENFFFGPEEEENFVTVGIIGEGKTSTIYKIIDKRTNIPICKKVLKTEGTSFKDLQNAIKEFQVLHTLRHPSICHALALNTSENVKNSKLSENEEEEEEITTVAFLLEFIDYNLIECLEKKMINSTLKARIIVEISHGLKYLHSKNMIYRDLKLSNIMLNSVFQAKLIDFGLVKINEYLLGDEMMNSISMKNKVFDSVFMSPELLKDEVFDNKTDVFSFGVVLYFLFIGSLPNQSIEDKMMDKQFDLPDASPSISKCCIELIRKCIEPDPKDRPSFEIILNILRENKYMLAADVDPSIVSQRDQELERISI